MVLRRPRRPSGEGAWEVTLGGPGAGCPGPCSLFHRSRLQNQSPRDMGQGVRTSPKPAWVGAQGIPPSRSAGTRPRQRVARLREGPAAESQPDSWPGSSLDLSVQQDTWLRGPGLGAAGRFHSALHSEPWPGVVMGPSVQPRSLSRKVSKVPRLVSSYPEKDPVPKKVPCWGKGGGKDFL